MDSHRFDHFNQQVIEEFRAGHGRVGGPFAGGRLLLLTTTGARTGARHTTPLGYLPDGPRRLVIASAGGAPDHPAWYHNLLAHPRVTVEDGTFTYEADAHALAGEERDRLFARAAEADPGWAAYQAKAGRTLPVVALVPLGVPPRTGPLGDSLRQIHDAFRRELTLIRAEVARSGPGVGAQLRVTCLSLCAGLGHHHATEDGHLFPYVAEHHPGLAAVLARLREEHQALAALLRRLQDLVSAARTDSAAVLAEVDQIIASLEAHLDHEEEQLVALLNG